MPKHKLLYRYWTREEDLVVLTEYGFTATTEIARRLCRTIKAVQQRATTLGKKVRPHDRWTKEETLLAFTQKCNGVPNRTSASVRNKRHRVKQGRK